MKAAISSLFRALMLVVVGIVATSAHAQSVTLAPASQGFPATVVGATTNPVTMTLINTGAAPLTIGNIAIGPDFTQTTTCGASLAPAARCTFSVRFAPLSVGAHPETLAITDSASGSPHVINLAGTGLRQASLSVSTLAFGSQAAGTSSASKPVTVTNTQAVAMTITGITVGADYQQTNTCGTSLPALGTCTVNVSFKPTGAGSRPGILSVSANIVSSPLTATLTGAGTPGLVVSPTGLDFGSQVVATSGIAKLVTITNGQTGAATISGVTSSGDFARTTTCGASLAAAASCSFSVTFTPTVAGSRSGTLSFVLGSSPVNVSLMGTGSLAAAVTVSPASLTFSTQRVGTASSPQVITIGNTTSTAVSISAPTISGDFARTATCGASLAANSSCTFSVTFSPTTVGSQTGALAFSLNGVPKNVSLTGTGAVALTMSPTGLTFNAQLLNTVSAAQVVTVTNSLADPVAMGATTISGDYQQTNSCTTLAAGASCTVNVTFKPIAAGARAGVLTLNPGGTAQTLSLTGTGSSTAVALNPTTLAFGNQALSTASLVKTVTLTNSQTSAVAITSIATNLADYTQTNTCGSSLAGSSSCVISVTLTPAAAGARTGTLTVKAGASTLNVSLTGTGVAAVVISPLSQGFPAQAVGTNGIPFNVTVRNNLNVPLGITGITLVGDFTNTTTCGSSLLPGTSCVVTVTFHPTATGGRTATLTITDDYAGTPQTVVTLTGTGLLPTVLSPTPVAFGNQVTGTASVAKVVTLRNQQTFPITITNVALTGDYAQTNTCGSSLAGSASCTYNVTFTPTVSGSRPGSLVVNVDQGTSPMTVSFTGAGVTPQATALPSAVTFGLQAVSTTSGSQTVTVKNNLAAAMTISGIVPAGDFTVTGTTCGATLAGNGSCTVSIAFAPTVTGARTGTLTITDTANNSPQVVMLSGSATLQATSVTVTPASVSLGIGATQQYTAMATFSDNSTMDVTSSATWSSGDPTVVTISSTGLATVLNSAITAIPITATFEGISNAATPAWLSALTALPPSCSAPQVDLKLLVISNGKTEADFGGIKQILDYMGTPYAVFDMADPANSAGITPAYLYDPNNSCHGFYNGVILANGGYIYTLTSPTPNPQPGSSMATLATYEQTFGVRQINWYTFPGTDHGFQGSTGNTAAGVTANFTPAGASVFSYVNAATAFTIPATVTAYFAKPLVPASGSGATVTPLISDASGNALSLVYNTGGQYPREILTQVFDSSQYFTHDMIIAYGLINWVSKGLFLGDYHIYAAAQIDDVFINDAEWTPSTPCISNSVSHDRTAVDATTTTFRMNKADVDGLVAWQSKVRQNPLLQSFTLQMAFNGIGTVGNGDWTGLAPGVVDDLVPEFVLHSGDFYWMTHTYDHPETLNGLPQFDPGGDPQPDFINLEILTNLYVASGTTQGGVNYDRDDSNTVTPLMLQNFNPINMVSPGVTGLNDLAVPGFLYDAGIRYVVTDTSVIGQPNNGPNPSPNVGIVNSYAPGIYEVPRYPNNIFYNTATWDDLQSEFQCIYSYPAPQPPYNTYTSLDILNFTVNDFVNNMLKGDMNPQMFHQPNLHFFTNNVAGMASNGQSSSLISDVYDATFTKYLSLFKLPVLSLPLDQIGQRMQDRNVYNLSQATATYTGGSDPTVTITIPPTATVTSATIPVTGLNSATAESYGGQNISHVPVTQGTSVTLPAQ